jgi:CheY-like chemotaxis protein
MEQHSPYILLVEDDCDDQAFFVDCVGKAYPGIEVKLSDNGHQALSFLAACPQKTLPAAIIIDYDMAFLNGAEVLFLLAAVPSFAAIPKIILSGCDRHFWRCRALGAKEYFVKVSSVEEMDAIIARVVALMESAC